MKQVFRRMSSFCCFSVRRSANVSMMTPNMRLRVMIMTMKKKSRSYTTRARKYGSCNEPIEKRERWQVSYEKKIPHFFPQKKRTRKKFSGRNFQEEIFREKKLLTSKLGFRRTSPMPPPLRKPYNSVVTIQLSILVQARSWSSSMKSFLSQATPEFPASHVPKAKQKGFASRRTRVKKKDSCQEEFVSRKRLVTRRSHRIRPGTLGGSKFSFSNLNSLRCNRLWPTSTTKSSAKRTYPTMENM